MILSEEHLLIRETAAELAVSAIAPLAVEADKDAKFPKEQIKAIAQQGMLLIKVPDNYGGGGGDVLSYTLLMEEVAKACGSTAMTMAAHALTADCILKFGSEEQKKEYLPKMATGDYFGGFALTEPEAGSDAGNVQTTADDNGDYYLLNGKKAFVTSGDYCDFVLVVAKTDATASPSRSMTTFLVDKEHFKVTNHVNKMGLRASHTVDIELVNAKVPKNAVLGSVGQGFKIAMSALDGGRIGIASLAVGLLQACVEESVAYTGSRVQFGHPISDNQAIRWMLADMHKDCEAARQLVWHAASLCDAGRDFGLAASTAKLFASEAVMNNAINAIQVQGGYGYCKPAKAERLFRDAKSTAIAEGTSEVQRMVISNYIVKK
ncbi:acyl-CoA dehydrogenase [Deferribacterales bacterium RsTz2092]|nr:butyryl-CoA dehydrogenase [Deferribacterales bacterium]